jgi:alkylation response protein AidB-like acyl-CoA dehydrogenase
MATTTASAHKITGGSFLLEDIGPERIFTYEDLTDEHRDIGRTVDAFWAAEVEPNLDGIRHQEPGLALRVLRKAAELGLTAVSIPERFGGMEMDLTSAMVVAEHLGKDGSYAGWQSTHTGIGTLPLLFFGNEHQKRKYLPKLAKVEMLAAYALTEPLAGSDALAARTRADLSPDDKHYILNGQKMWITNGGAADLFTVFAKVGGERFTAFLVERNFPGVSSGAEEQKMGIKGSSTTAVYFDNVPVPVENVLGEIGRGHVIAFNILNVGRLKLGPAVLGKSKHILEICLKYAKQRKAFGSAIAEFGAMQHKVAEMAIRIYAAEAMVWRVVGSVEEHLRDSSSASDRERAQMKALEEFASECSMVKVYASETLDYVVDEGVQIHGGYGFHQDYTVERAYRDSRINRIFEGTNEINRLIITGMLLKRAARGGLELTSAARSLAHEALAGQDGIPDEHEVTDEQLVRNAKKIALLTIGIASDRYSGDLEKQQEIIMNISDILMDSYAMESTLLRTIKLGSAANNANRMCSVILRDSMTRIETAARNILGECLEGSALRNNLNALRRLAQYEPIHSIQIRRRIARTLIDEERYAV